MRVDPELLIAARDEGRIIELSHSAYQEIWDCLVDAGYDWLVFPDSGQIPMEGFIIRRKD